MSDWNEEDEYFEELDEEAQLNRQQRRDDLNRAGRCVARLRRRNRAHPLPISTTLIPLPMCADAAARAILLIRMKKTSPTKTDAKPTCSHQVADRVGVARRNQHSKGAMHGSWRRFRLSSSR